MNAYNIKATGLARVGGRHLSAAPNDPMVDAPESWPQPPKREWPFKSVADLDARINREVIAPIMRGEA